MAGTTVDMELSEAGKILMNIMQKSDEPYIGNMQVKYLQPHCI